jgi:hypothetical protein
MSALAYDRHFRDRSFKGHGFLITGIITALIGLIFGIFASLSIQWLAPLLFG